MSPERVNPGGLVSGEEVVYSNFRYDPACYYFIYIGELKAYGLNHFLGEALQKMHAQREVRFLAIIPDRCVQYYEKNLMVINPEVKSPGGDTAVPPTVGRAPIGHFMAAVSSSPTVRTLISRILTHQRELYLSMFESVVEMTLDEIPGVSILGPDKAIARHWNSKLVQSRELAGIVSLVEGEICRGREALLARTAALRTRWREGIFVSAAYSAAGANSAVTANQLEVERRFTVEESDYLISRYIPHELDPTVLAVVAGPEEVYIAGIADQQIVDGNRFVGSSFPSQVRAEQRQELRRQTIAAGRALGRAGYRGIFGCDYLIDRDGKVWFLEINARKQGTTFEFCCTLEQHLPPGAPSLLALEYHAVRHSTFPAETVEMGESPSQVYWQTYNHKLTNQAVTCGYIPQNTRERESFTRVASGELVMDYVVVEHLGAPLTVMPGTFLARVISVAESNDKVALGLEQGMAQIRQTFIDVCEK
jgi:ATP-grasp domain